MTLFQLILISKYTLLCRNRTFYSTVVIKWNYLLRCLQNNETNLFTIIFVWLNRTISTYMYISQVKLTMKCNTQHCFVKTKTKREYRHVPTRVFYMDPYRISNDNRYLFDTSRHFRTLIRQRRDSPLIIDPDLLHCRIQYISWLLTC